MFEYCLYMPYIYSKLKRKAMLEVLLFAYIEMSHGNSVAQQFQNSFNGEKLENQSTAALGYIQSELEDLLEDDELFHKYAHTQVNNYLNRLTEFLNK